jgi:hypothetical protein
VAIYTYLGVVPIICPTAVGMPLFVVPTRVRSVELRTATGRALSTLRLALGLSFACRPSAFRKPTSASTPARGGGM